MIAHPRRHRCGRDERGMRPCRPWLPWSAALASAGRVPRACGTWRSAWRRAAHRPARAARYPAPAGGSGHGWLVAGRWISRLCCVDGQKGCDQDQGVGGVRHWHPVLRALERARSDPPARIAPGELQSSSSSSVSSVLPVLASRELDGAAVPVLRLDLVLAVLALDLVHLAIAFGLQLGEHLLHRDRRRGRRLLAGLPRRLIALGEGALDDAEADPAVARRPPSPTASRMVLLFMSSPCRVKSADHLQTATA